jgi:alkylation response protein AidB-like acyl-CoA dehydrogenase
MGYLHGHPVVDRARDLVPLLVEHRGTAELEARIARPVHEAMSDAGLFRLMAPVEVGGLELAYPFVLAAIEEIAVGDITASWYVVNSTQVAIRSAYMTVEDREQVMAPSAANFAFSGLPSGRAVAVDGGFEVSGQWPLVTGCADSRWAFLNGIVDHGETGGRPDIRHFIIETAGLEIQDNWQQVAGMRGTGSNGVIADNVFVPDGLAHTPGQPAVLDRPLFKLPMFTHAAATSAAAVLGAWRSGLECIVSSIATYQSAVDGSSPGDDEFNQELVAASDASLRAARAGFAVAADEFWEAAQHNGQPPADVRARMYATVTYTIDTARDSISRLYAASSRATFEQNHPAEQALRNIHAFSNPLDKFRRFSIDAGRVMLDRQPRSPRF